MAQEKNSRQLVVIGAGPGGYAAAFTAADLGMRVTLIDLEKNPGGVCLYRGCIPSKALLHLAKIITDAAAVGSHGVEFSAPKIDVDKVRSYKNGVIQKLVLGLAQLCKLRKIEYIQGMAAFIDSNTLEVKRKGNGTERISFDKAILATGASAVTIPNIPAASALVMDSTRALELESIPESMLVVGGGYIGLELGTVYAALGTKVSVVEMTPGLMPGSDPELVSILAKRLGKLFDSIMLSTTVAQIKEHDGGLKVALEAEQGPTSEKSYERVLVAAGRKPNSAGLGLQNTRVQTDEKGFVKVNNKLQTDDASIYAVGDLVGGPLLAHKASHEARIAARVIAGLDVAFGPKAIPFVEYTDPEVAECGLSEKQALKENRPIKVAKFPWAASGRAATMGQSDGLTKLIIDPGTEKVLGVGIVGTGAGELISEGALAIEMGAGASDIASTIHPHPTLSETVMEAAEVFLGNSLHFYRPRRP
ncbi:MAG TPA: dihydrolipoyl dehydrogenase [Sedimentisphaerales bacterium]|nr:dihydrolipoyl dehydrogenase [Sedimentisphaerales bacterium]